MPKPGYKIVRLFPRYNDEEICDDWDVDNVENMIKIIDYRGRTPPFSDEGIPHLRSNNIRNGNIILDELTFVSEKTYDEYMTRGIPQENDVLFTTEGPLGEVSLVPKNFKFSLAQRIIVLRPKNKKIHPAFLKYLLLDRKIKIRYEGLATGTTLGGIASKWFYKILLPYPNSYSEQQKIASILSNIDNLIDTSDKVINSTKLLKRGLMQTLLTKGIGHTKFRKIKTYFGKFEEIPENWTVENLENLCQIRKENNVHSDLYVGLEHISQGTNLLIGRGNVVQFTSTKNIFKKGDVLYGKLRPLLNKVWLSTEDGYCSTDILPLKVKEKLDNRILVTLLTSQDFVLFASSTSAGTKMPRTNWSDIRKYKIKLPPIQEQQKIVSILSTVDDKISEFESKKTSLVKLKKGLMQKLLTGQIRVKI